MARVTAYEASDGSLHRDKKVYLRHEANLVVAKKLLPLIETQVDDPAKAAEVHDLIINGIGLNALRDLFAVPFKPEDGEGDGENGAAPEGGAMAATAVEAQPAEPSTDI